MLENERQLKKRTKTANKLRKKDPLWDKKRSRNCKEFWIEKGLTEEESIIKAKESMDDIHKKTSIIFESNPKKYASKYNTKIEYYLKRGHSEEESLNILSERQSTFSLNKCIKGHGDKVGTKIWLKRQEKWQKSLSENGNIKGGYSKISQILFYDILKHFEIIERDSIFFWTKNKEHLIKSDKKNIFI